MDNRPSMRRLSEIIEHMSREELAATVLNVARQLTPIRREALLAQFEGEAAKRSPRQADASALESLKKAVMELATGARAISCRYEYEGYEEWRNEPDPVRVFRDRGGTLPEIRRILDALEAMVADGLFAQAVPLYQALLETRIPLEYEEESWDEDSLSLAEMRDEELLDEADLRHAAALCLYAVYRSTAAEGRADALYGHQAWKEWGDISLNALLSVGPEPLPQFDRFLSDWINKLKAQQNPAWQSMLWEAAVLRDGEDAVGPLSRQVAAGCPDLSVKWFELLLKRNAHTQICQEAEGAVHLLAANPKARQRVAQIAAFAAAQEQRQELRQAMALECYRAKPDVSNLLRLLLLPDASAFEKARSIPPGDLLTRFFQGEFSPVFHRWKENHASLGYFLGTDRWLMSLYLLLPLEAEALTPPMQKMLDAMGLSCGFVQAFDDPPFHRLYALWRRRIPVESPETYLPYCEQMALTCIRNIVGGQQRHSYNVAAELAVLLAQAKNALNPACTVAEAARVIRDEFPRHRLFQHEFAAYGL